MKRRFFIEKRVTFIGSIKLLWAANLGNSSRCSTRYQIVYLTHKKNPRNAGFRNYNMNATV